MPEVEGLRYKINKKVKLKVGKAKVCEDDSKPVNARRKLSDGSNKGPSSKYKIDGTILYERENGGKKNSRSLAEDKRNLNQEGYDGEVNGRKPFRQSSTDRKRKRIYADQDDDGEGMQNNVNVQNKKPLSKEGKHSSRDDSRSRKAKSHDVQQLSAKFSSSRSRKSSKDEFIDGKSSKKALLSLRLHGGMKELSYDSKSSSHRLGIQKGSAEVSNEKIKSKVKTVEGKVYSKLDGSEDDSLKKHGKSMSEPTKHTGQKQHRHMARSLEKTLRKMRRDKKALDNDCAVPDAPPKKRKRVIRIDPHDISNKRLDDGISANESYVKKEEDIEKAVEISKNAQFRAIQPSPSILSFVEDNLLGRRRLIELRRSGYNINLSAPLDNIPFSTNPERERIEETVFRNKLTFFAAAKVSSSFPPPDLPEIAFAGRSNVGKSSLLNALTRQWGVVRTSDKPGLTQTINFFKLGSKLCLVDLPGYGFAYAKEEVKEAWEELVKEYVSTRIGLKRVCLLIDTKWGMKPRDHELINLMERSQTKYQIVLTKTDVVFPIDVARRAMQIEEGFHEKTC
ncbi:PREDICTED: uncharacterized protein LOC104594530 isoform X2 [Nelumbo nucifera]|uniref:Uncharacterized protein LOC104594530 isoform X2 n=1 Tax=Nelumbo nucifera TaxID=4432 RepID=A0A1U7ZVT6_NELNU|nr:PREDICTED: uncharacterized protein LOC104594530 isoform X2 [Nelumbo nucifera]